MHRVGTGGPGPHPPTKVCLSDGNLQQLAAQPDSSPNKGHICGQGTSKSLSEQMFGMWLSKLAFLPAPLWEFETTAPPPHLVPYELEDWRVRGPEKQPPKITIATRLLNICLPPLQWKCFNNIKRFFSPQKILFIPLFIL